MSFLKIAVPLFVLLFLPWGAKAQAIEMDYIPPLGSSGNAEGHVVWSGLTAANAGQYAIIALVDGAWTKPTWANYLNPIDAGGNFAINITTGGNDNNMDNVLFYLVNRANYVNVPDGSGINSGTIGNWGYLAMLAVSRAAFWANMVYVPVASVTPGFVLAGTTVTLSSTNGDSIYYTLDGSAPTTNSTLYASGTSFTVPSTGCLLIHAIAARSNGLVSQPTSFLYLPRRPLDKPFFGLNVSLIFGSENPGDALSEAATRARLQPIAPLTQWIRTFSTINNGHPYINRIAKTELGLRTLIGIYVSTDDTANAAQITGLNAILDQGPAPDLIVVGNECSQIGVSDTTLSNMIVQVRTVLTQHGLGANVPVGSSDVGGANWPSSVLNQLDFVGVNIYCGTWDMVPQDQMAAATKQSYTNEIQRLSQRMIMLTEIGTPYDGGTYLLPDGSGTQTASQTKAVNYLNAMLDWTREGRIPLFYFESFDEAWKTRQTDILIEQYFGLLDTNGALHPFFADSLTRHQPPVHIDGIAITLASVKLSWLDGNAQCVVSGKTNLTDAAWIPLAEDMGTNGVEFNRAKYPFRFFHRTPPD